jgi:hypothetical protein
MVAAFRPATKTEHYLLVSNGSTEGGTAEVSRKTADVDLTVTGAETVFVYEFKAMPPPVSKLWPRGFRQVWSHLAPLFVVFDEFHRTASTDIELSASEMPADSASGISQFQVELDRSVVDRVLASCGAAWTEDDLDSIESALGSYIGTHGAAGIMALAPSLMRAESLSYCSLKSCDCSLTQPLIILLEPALGS